jgi:hypothetical protein
MSAARRPRALRLWSRLIAAAQATLLLSSFAACANPEQERGSGDVAVPASGADWRLRCSVDKGTFELHSDSLADEVLDDDMRVELRARGGSAAPLDLPPAWYRPARLEGAPASVCEGSEAVDLGQGHALVLLTHSRRPRFDGLTAVVVDAAAGAALATTPFLGEVRERSRLQWRDGRLGLELVSAYGGDADTPEHPISAWHRLGFERGQLRLQRVPEGRQ